MELLAIPFGLAGALWGHVSDQIAARWPAHEDGSVRGQDWRTVVLIAFGLVALAVVPVRFEDWPQRVIFGAFFGLCVLMMATDLDQRLLPLVLTLPVIVGGAIVLLWGGNELVNRQPLWLPVVVAVVVPLLLFLGSLPFGSGAFGEGDVWFLIGAGLLLGAIRLVIGLFIGTLFASIVIIALVLARRITLKDYVPFGPFLILGMVAAALLPVSGS